MDNVTLTLHFDAAAVRTYEQAEKNGLILTESEIRKHVQIFRTPQIDSLGYLNTP